MATGHKVMTQQALCAMLEAVINRVLAVNTASNEALHKLEQKTLTIKLAELSFPVSFSVCQQQIAVTGLTERNDCQVDTSMTSLIELKKQQQITTLIKQDKLDLQGDIQVAQQFLMVAESVDIDWQTELAQHIGDIPTYKLVQMGYFLQKKIRFAGQQIQADASEWLLHEIKAVIHSDEMQRFSQQVSSTSLATDRLQNRIDLLLANQLKS